MKHKKSNFRILTECDHGYIGICDCCREFNFAYKNTLLTFQEDEMCRFFDWVIANRNSPEHYMPMQHGRSKVFSSPNSNLFLVYHDDELDEILLMYSQTKLMIEAQKVLLSNRMN
jgi:hypothetical protein